MRGRPLDLARWRVIRWGDPKGCLWHVRWRTDHRGGACQASHARSGRLCRQRLFQAPRTDTHADGAPWDAPYEEPRAVCWAEIVPPSGALVGRSLNVVVLVFDSVSFPSGAYKVYGTHIHKRLYQRREQKNTSYRPDFTAVYTVALACCVNSFSRFQADWRRRK